MYIIVILRKFLFVLENTVIFLSNILLILTCTVFVILILNELINILKLKIYNCLKQDDNSVSWGL